MPEFKSNSSEMEQLQPDDWRYKLPPVLLRNEHRDDFREREPSESNPDNYVVEIYPKINSEQQKRDSTQEYIARGYKLSGIIDLRTNNNGKYTVWLGTDHMALMYGAARVPDNTIMSQYLIGIKLDEEKGGKNMHILKDYIGQSCKRTGEQIDKILNAVDIVLKRTFN